MTSAERYEQELKQSDIDHHTPTAGAMTGHIIANLLIHSLKISQAKLFAQGPAALFLAQTGDKWIEYEQAEFAKLNRLLVNSGESIPTTTDQYKQFTMLEEDGVFLCSGIIDTRAHEVENALRQAGLKLTRKREKNGWVALEATK